MSYEFMLLIGCSPTSIATVLKRSVPMGWLCLLSRNLSMYFLLQLSLFQTPTSTKRKIKKTAKMRSTMIYVDDVYGSE